MSELRLGVIGAGDVAVRHLEGFERSPEVRVVRIAEPDPERRARFAALCPGAAASAEAADVLADPAVDMAVILTPHRLHAPLVLRALEAGKHVLCEKPLATRLADCDRMLDAARGSGRTLLATHSLRVEPFYRAMSARLASGELGRPFGAALEWYTDEGARLDAPGHWKGTREESGGGVLIDGGCHVADTAQGLLGRVVRVHAFAGKLAARRPEVAEDTAVLSLEHASGALSTCFLSFTGGSARRAGGSFAAGMRAELYAERGRLSGGYLYRDGVMTRWCEEAGPEAPARSILPEEEARAGDIDAALIAAWRGLGPPPVTALDARNAVAVIEAAYQSLARGAAEEVPWREA